ncbi:Myb-like DNA-binding protein [Globisporangium polare]
MTISPFVRSQYFAPESNQLIRLSPRKKRVPKPEPRKCPSFGKYWTLAEHERFLEGLRRYPSGPWKLVAAYVGTRTVRQTMSHAQKYREKIGRRGPSQFAMLSHDELPEEQQEGQQDLQDIALPLSSATPATTTSPSSTADLAGYGATVPFPELDPSRFDGSVLPPPPPSPFPANHQSFTFLVDPALLEELFSAPVPQGLAYLNSPTELDMWDFGPSGLGGHSTSDEMRSEVYLGTLPTYNSVHSTSTASFMYTELAIM